MRAILYTVIPAVLLNAPLLLAHQYPLWHQLIRLSNGTLIYYLWVNEEKAQHLLAAKTCDDVLSYVDKHAKTDNYLGPGIYASSNIFDSAEHGNVLLEMHVPLHAKKLHSYPRPGNDNIIWYFTRDLRNIEFHHFTGAGLNTSELQKMIFQAPWHDAPGPTHHSVAMILWQRISDKLKWEWRNSTKAILMLPGFYQVKVGMKSGVGIRGFLLVNNLSYHKKVTAHYTLNQWQTIQQASAFYTGHDAPSGKEIWSYAIDLPLAGSAQLEIYFSYENLENGETHYESKKGNFTLNDFNAT